MNPLIWALCSALIISLLSIIGVFTSLMHVKILKRLMLLLVAFSAGTLLGEAFIHLIPKALETLNLSPLTLSLFLGIIIFLIGEASLHWHHCHHGHCNVTKYSYASLAGDLIHNFIDGLIIITAYNVNISLGIATSFAIIIHEIPQEIDDFEILINTGFTKSKAILFDFLLSLTIIIGILIGYLIEHHIFTKYLLPFAAGGFVYVAFTELLPHLHYEPEVRKTVSSLMFFVAGIVFMYALKLIIG